MISPIRIKCLSFVFCWMMDLNCKRTIRNCTVISVHLLCRLLKVLGRTTSQYQSILRKQIPTENPSKSKLIRFQFTKMGQRSFATFVILVSNCVLLGAAKQVKIISNCTLDDLRNINDGHKLAEPSESTSTPSPPPSQPLIKLNLVFEDCDLPTLPDPILVDVPSVQSVNLTHSNLSTISPYALSGLKTLESLIVVANPNLTLLQSWTPHNIVGLIELDLHGNGISELDTLALRRYPQLSNLNLSTNFIQEIPVGFFDFSLNIDTLDLSANLLRRIESNTFKALSRLANINLAYNQINFIDSYAFTTVTRLKRLHLNGNQISTIDSVVFYNLARLQHLDLNSNALDEGSIEKEAFLQNSHLLTLDISNNSFSTIHTTTLGGLTALQVCFESKILNFFTLQKIWANFFTFTKINSLKID